MPTVSDRPRSAGGSSRGGRVSSTPRSSSGSTPRRTSSAPRGLDFSAIARSTNRPVRIGGQSAGSWIREAEGKQVGAGAGFTPVRVVLDVASAPFYATGNLLSGRPLESVKNIASFGQLGRKTFVSDAPIVASGIKRIPGPSWLRTGVGIGVDFATDPLTYVSFGAGGAIRGAAGQAARGLEKSAARELEKATSRALASGRSRASAGEVAEAMISGALARRAAPSSAKVYARIPLSRNRRVLIAESKLLARAVQAIAKPVRGSTPGTALRRIFRADQGVDAALYEGRRGVRYWGESTLRDLTDAIGTARKDVAKLGNERELAEFLTRHLDQPIMYPPRTPAQREAAARVVTLRDEIEQISRDAGIDMGYVPNYVMHLPADRQTAAAFEKRFGRKAENQPYTRKRVLENLDQWEELGLKPDLNVWNLLQVRAEQGVRDAAIKGYFDVLAARGVKPPPQAMPDVGGQAIRTQEAEDYLASLMQRGPTGPSRQAVTSAQADLRAARAAYATAQTAPNYAAIARAERALKQAQETADPLAVAARVQPAVSEQLEVAGHASRSRRATQAWLPEPGAARFRRRRPTDVVAARRLNRAARLLREEADELDDMIYRALREDAKSRKQIAKGDSKTIADRSGRQVVLEGNEGFRHGSGRPEDLVADARYIHNQRDDVARTYGQGSSRRDKNLRELADDFLEEMRRREARGEDTGFAEMIETADEVARLRGQADDIERAVRGRNAPEGSIEFGPEDRAAAATRFEELASDLGAVVDTRKRRARGAARHGEQETPRAARNAPGDGDTRRFSPDARRRFREFFNGRGPLTEAIDGARETAMAEVKAAQAVARRQVQTAQRALERVKGSTDPLVKKDAARALRDAQRTERAVSEQLAAAKATFGGNPREIAAATRRLVEEQRTLRRMESQARKVVRENQALAARPGAPSSYGEYRELVEQGWQTHTSKYHRDTLLPPETAEVVRKVDAEMARLIGSDSAVEAFGRFFNQTGAAWKSLQLMTPRYHLRNILDDGLADWLAGARNPVSYTQAARIKRGGGGFVTIKGRKVPDEQILAWAETQGVLHQGFAAWEVAKQQEAGLRGRLAGRISPPGSGRLARGSRKLGEIREDWTRLGLFIEMLKKGEDPIEAGLTVRRWRYDYADLSPALMRARAVALPFLTFTWKTIPLLGHLLVTRPGAYSKTNMIAEWLNEEGGRPDRSLLAPWAADSFAVPAPDAVKRAYQGDPNEPILFNPRITFRYADLEMLNPRPEALSRNLGGMLGPAVVPVTALTGYSFFRGRQIRPGERTRAPALIEAMNNVGIPIPGYGPKRDAFTKQEVPGYSARLHDILATFPPFQQTGAMIPGGGITDSQRGFWRWGTGLNLSPEQRDRALFYATRYGRTE